MGNLDKVPVDKEHAKFKTRVHAQVLKKGLGKYDALKQKMQAKGKITPNIER